MGMKSAESRNMCLSLRVVRCWRKRKERKLLLNMRTGGGERERSHTFLSYFALWKWTTDNFLPMCEVCYGSFLSQFIVKVKSMEGPYCQYDVGVENRRSQLIIICIFTKKSQFKCIKFVLYFHIDLSVPMCEWKDLGDTLYFSSFNNQIWRTKVDFLCWGFPRLEFIWTEKSKTDDATNNKQLLDIE